MAIPTQGETKIVIEMSGGTGEGTGDPSPASPEPVDDPSQNKVKGSKNKQAWLALAANQAVNVAKQGVNAAVSNIGIATGNYYQQQKTERALSSMGTIASLAATFAVSPIAGIASVAGMAISGYAETFKQNKEREIENYQAEQYAKRLGYTRSRK